MSILILQVNVFYIIFIDRVALAKQRDNALGIVPPFVSFSKLSFLNSLTKSNNPKSTVFL